MNFYQNQLFLLLATSIAHLANFIFHLYLSRHLGPVDYGIFLSLLSIFLIASVPVSAIQTITSRAMAAFKAQEREDRIEILFNFLFKRLGLAAAGVTIGLMALSPYLKNFLHLSSPSPLIILAASIFFVLIWSLFLGVLQGLERFAGLGLNISLSAILRLSAGMGLVSWGLGVNGAIMASGISALAGIFLACLSGTKGRLSRSQSTALEAVRDSLRPLFPMLLTFFCFTVMLNIDVFLVRHFFQPEVAGYYAAASLIGKIIFYVSSPIALVMFPRATSLYYQGKPSLAILKKSVGLAGLISGFLVSLYFLFPGFFIRMIPGREYLAAASLVGLYGLAMAIFSLVNLFLFYHLSADRLNFLLPLLVMTGLEIILISLFHQSLEQILFILLGAGASLLLWNIAVAYKGLKP